MDLSTKLLKDFSKIVNEPSNEEKPSTQAYGTVKVVYERKFVQLDGSEVLTPISEVVDAQDGDRVLVSIENHRATILGNFTYPPSARKEQEALSKSEDAEEKAQEALDATEEYSEQISAANAAAQEAKTNASSANSLATEASAKADQVYTLAEEAKSAAQEAESKAGSAMTNVEAANQALSTLQTEVSGVKTDISTIRSDVQSDLDTFTQTVSQNYAAKTDLTTLEGTLTAKINQSVAGLEVTFSDNYVAKSDHVTITENLQAQITHNAEGISSSAKKITQLEADTTEAQKAIDAAQADADSALAAAGEAQTKANAAQTAANEASAKATAADTALTQAKADLATAQANLAAVTGRVDATEEEIAAAQADVEAAQTAVNKAQADATAAQTAASEAKTAASTATSKAQEAKNAADKAQADADALKSRVTTAETKIEQTAESLKTTATLADTANNNATIAKTTAEQTATKFSWIVKSGSSSSNFEITDRMAALTASYINLNGLVTFSGLDSSTQTSISNASTNASQANTKATNAVNQALEAKGDAATAKSTADTASSNASTALSTANTANANASAAANQLAAWCHANNKTLIDGSKIYTGSITATQIATGTITANEIAGKTITAAEIATATITANEIAGKTITAAEIKAGTITASEIATGAITADKISVTSLSAICATIGGFTIGDSALYTGTTGSIGITNSVYIGTDGISCSDAFKAYNTGLVKIRAYDSGNDCYSNFIFGEEGAPLLVCDDKEWAGEFLIISEVGIRRENGKNLSFENSFEFRDYICTIGTEDGPSSHHYLSNNSAIYSKNTSDQLVAVLRLSDGNDIRLGWYSNRTRSTYIYTGNQGTFAVNESNSDGKSGNTMLSLSYSNSKRIFKVPCVYENTTSSGSNIRMVDSDGVFYRYSSSSRRYKDAISEKLSEHLDPHKLYDIPVVEFVYKDGHLSKDDERYGQKFIGFIAEDIDDIYPIAANHNSDGTVENWNVDLIVPGMLKLIQEQHKVDITLNSQVETLKNQLDEAMIKIASLEKQIDILKTA